MENINDGSVKARELTITAPAELQAFGLTRLEIHLVESGRGDPVLFLHGNPTSSHLWRNVLPVVASRGRAIAIDLLGHGLSQKPDIPYTFDIHSAVVRTVVETLELKNVLLVLHDWGGPLGFRFALENRGLVRGVVAMETFPWPLRWADFPPAFRLLFRAFRTPVLGRLLLQNLNLFVEKVLPAAVASPGAISAETLAVYRSFHPTVGSRRSIREWPRQLPLDPRDRSSASLRRIERGLPGLGVPLLWLWAEPGAITTKARLRWLEESVPRLTLRSVGKGGHYIPEEVPEAIAREIVAWMDREFPRSGHSSSR